MATRKIVLAKPADWETWISFLKTKATNLGVWELVNPDLTEKPAAKERPAKPIFEPPQDAAQIDNNAFNLFKIQSAVYKLNLDEYEREQKAFTDITNFIHDTLAIQVAAFTKGADADPWSQLRALKLKLAPTDQARKMEVERLYHRLKKGPGNRDLEAWIQDWELMYADAKLLSIEETLEAQRPQRDFLVAIAKYEPAFSDNYLLRISDEGESFEMQRIIEKFRHLARLKQMAHVHQTDSHAAAFAANSTSNISTNSEIDTPKPTFNNRNLSGMRLPATPDYACVCGCFHFYRACCYLRPEIRPPGWKPIPKEQALVNEAWKNPDKRKYLQEKVQKAREIDAMKKTPNPFRSTTTTVTTAAAAASTITPESTNASEFPDTATFAACSFFSTDSFSLRTSWILDGGSNAHICNKTMLHRFSKTRDGEGERMAAGREIFPIQCYGTVQITVASPTGPKTVTLTNVYYVPEFMTNVVAGHRLEEKGVHFDS